MKKVVTGPQQRIDDFEQTACEFFRAVLGMDYRECIVTDESRLSFRFKDQLPSFLHPTQALSC